MPCPIVGCPDRLVVALSDRAELELRSVRLPTPSALSRLPWSQPKVYILLGSFEPM